MAAVRISGTRRLEAEQRKVDLLRQAEGFTSGDYDLCTGDYQVWVGGEGAGYAGSFAEACRRSTAQQASTLGKAT